MKKTRKVDTGEQKSTAVQPKINTPLDQFSNEVIESAGSSAPSIDDFEIDAASSFLTRVREDILNCTLRPGQRLRFVELRQLYQVSVASLREALFVLSAQGLVQFRMNYGFRVAPVSLDDLLEVADLRLNIEIKTLQAAITHGDDAWEARIIAAHHMLLVIEEKLDPSQWNLDPQWSLRHRKFHAELASGCPSQWMLHFRAQLFDQAHRYRRLSSIFGGNWGGQRGEHHAILKACLERNTESACALTEQHIRLGVKGIRAQIPGWAATDN